MDSSKLILLAICAGALFVGASAGFGYYFYHNPRRRQTYIPPARGRR